MAYHLFGSRRRGSPQAAVPLPWSPLEPSMMAGTWFGGISSVQLFCLKLPLRPWFLRWLKGSIYLHARLRLLRRPREAIHPGEVHFYSIQLIWTELFSSCNCPKFLTRFLRRPVGFFQKYPAIVTGFFFFMWYVTWFLWSEYQLGLRNLFTIFSSLFQVLPERNFQHSQQEDLQLLPLSLVRIPLYILMLFFS